MHDHARERSNGLSRPASLPLGDACSALRRVLLARPRATLVVAFHLSSLRASSSWLLLVMNASPVLRIPVLLSCPSLFSLFAASSCFSPVRTPACGDTIPLRPAPNALFFHQETRRRPYLPHHAGLLQCPLFTSLWARRRSVWWSSSSRSVAQLATSVASRPSLAGPRASFEYAAVLGPDHFRYRGCAAAARIRSDASSL